MIKRRRRIPGSYGPLPHDANSPRTARLPARTAMMAAVRHVRGQLFVDYVRMLRAQKTVDWSQRLTAEDIWFLSTRIDPDAWYPMETFERMGNEILRTV